MRVVLIHRYFWPDTPTYAHILKEIAAALAAAGHDVTVLTCQPSYNRAVISSAPREEQLGPRLRVLRWPVVPDRRFGMLKAGNLVLFCARVLGAARWLGRVDVVMTASMPPIAVARAGSWLARRTTARFVYYKQDIYPEVPLAPGIMHAGLLARLLRLTDSATERRADRVVVLSGDMADSIRARGVPPTHIKVINNFDPWMLDAEPGVEDASPRADGRLDLAFAGNLGRFQNLETVIKAAGLLAGDAGITLHFFGDGALRPELERRAAERGMQNVRFYGYRPPAEVATILQEHAILGVVSLLPGVIRSAYPSKTMTYLRQGCPVLALVGADSDLAQSIESAGAGFQAEPTHAVAIAETIRRLAGRGVELADMRRRARTLYAREFSQAGQLKLWRELFKELDDRGGAP